MTMDLAQGAEPRSDKGKPRWQPWIPLATSLLLFFWMNPALFQRLSALKTVPGKGMLLLTFFLAWGALAACVIAPRAWAVLALFFFSVNLLISTTFARVMGRSMSLNDAQNLKEAMGNTLDAVHQYNSTIWMVVLAGALLAALLLWARRQAVKRSSIPLLACSFSVVLSYGVFFARGGSSAMLFFPGNFESSMHAAALSAEPLIRKRVVKEENPIPTQNVALDPAVKHIVLVIDESIEGKVFHDAMKNRFIENAIDLGIAYSYANNSSASNLLLRRLADPDGAEQSIRQFPSVFELAKQRGFFTAYIDPQGVLSDSNVQNYFDANEKRFIDLHPPFETYGPRHQRDLRAVQVLLEVLAQHEKSFILVNKQGSHIPYAMNLPPEMAAEPDPYRASIERTSIGFLAGIAPHLPKGTLVFYTSDHGQNFHRPSPHNNIPGECSISEWQVPMVILYSPDLKAWADRVPLEWHDGATHAAAAESIRILLGIRNPAVTPLTAPPSPRERIQHRGYYGSPRGLFGEPAHSLWIDKQRQVFTQSAPGN